jgi:hypothetical protein
MAEDKTYTIRLANAGMYYDIKVVGEIADVRDGLVFFECKDGTMFHVGTHQILWIEDEASDEVYLTRTGWIK